MRLSTFALLSLFTVACTRSNPGLLPGLGGNGGNIGNGGGIGTGGGNGNGGGSGNGGAPGNDDMGVPPDVPDMTQPPPPPNDYGKDGPNTFTTTNVDLNGPSGPFTIIVYVPDGSGQVPVVMLSGGESQPADAYVPYARRLASWGIAAILRDDPGFGVHLPPGGQVATLAGDIAYVVDAWLKMEANAMPSPMDPLAGRVALDKIALAGHARGGQTSLYAAEMYVKGIVRAVFGLDPIDPTTFNEPDARTDLPNIGIPTGFIGEVTDDAPNGCAPATDNFEVLYKAAPSPSFQITAIHADATQFEDQNACMLCNLCVKGTAQSATVLAYSVKYLTAFFARELLGDKHVGATLDGAGIAADIAAGLVKEISK